MLGLTDLTKSEWGDNSSRIKTRSQFFSISKDSKGNFLIKVSLRYEESIQHFAIGEVEKMNRH